MAPAILGLLQFAPDIIDLFSSDKGNKIQKTADIVEGIAAQVTGKTGQDAVAELAANPELAYKFRTAVLADKHVDEELRYADRANAREMYKTSHEASDRIALAIMRWNLPLIGLLIVANVVAAKYLDADVMLGIASTIGFVIQSLLKERQDVSGFHFGSSMGSKLKGEK